MLAVVAVAVISASCRKERTCTCNWTTTTNVTISGNTSTSTSTGTDKWTYDKIKKRDARVFGQCLDHTDKSSNASGSITYDSTTENTCKLD